MSIDAPLRVLELYSGIGGMHYALKECAVPFEVVGAVDINTVANQIYIHNHQSTRLLCRAIESLTVKELNKLAVDMIVMSPPCQPFVRVGKHKDSADPRSKSFLHLLEILPKLEKVPNYIFLENVKGFDLSETRQMLLTILETCNYQIQEFLLSPLQFGVPNSRLRYYLMAKRRPFVFDFPMKNEIQTDIPDCAQLYLVHRVSPSSVTNSHYSDPAPNESDPSAHIDHTPSSSSASSSSPSTPLVSSQTSPAASKVTYKSDLNSGTNSDQSNNLPTQDNAMSDDADSDTEEIVEEPMYERMRSICGRLADYLEEDRSEEYLAAYLVEEKFLHRFWVMDIVKPFMTNCCCFTKRYAHHMEGAGSVIQMNLQSNTDLSIYKREREYTEEVATGVRAMKLRYFTPREISNLMCFPPEFGFPADLRPIQCYRVLGNSLNVHVVTVLLRLMTLGDETAIPEQRPT